MKIKLFGAARCHKTQHYQQYFKERALDFEFLDVEENESHAEELRSLYTNRKLNFPTITLNNKKLRNPSDEELSQWIQK
jgi:arsenate reductase-like glutaredoxin family protein